MFTQQVSFCSSWRLEDSTLTPRTIHTKGPTSTSFWMPNPLSFGTVTVFCRKSPPNSSTRISGNCSLQWPNLPSMREQHSRKSRNLPGTMDPHSTMTSSERQWDSSSRNPALLTVIHQNQVPQIQWSQAPPTRPAASHPHSKRAWSLSRKTLCKAIEIP